MPLGSSGLSAVSVARGTDVTCGTQQRVRVWRVCGVVSTVDRLGLGNLLEQPRSVRGGQPRQAS